MDICKDNVPKIEAIRHAVKFLEKKQKVGVIVSLQANSPNVTAVDIDNCISDLFLKKKKEVISLDRKLNQNAAIRVMTKETVFNEYLSTYFSCTINDAMDIHDKKDLNKIKKIMKDYVLK